MQSQSISGKRSRTQTEFLNVGESGMGVAKGLDDNMLKRARKLTEQKRRLTKSWKAMVLQAVLAVAPDFSSAVPLEEVIRKIAQLHPSFATKAEGKTKMLLDDLTKDGYVHVWCPGEVLELEDDDVELQEPGEEEEGVLPPVMAMLASDAPPNRLPGQQVQAVGTPGSPVLADMPVDGGEEEDEEGGARGGAAGFKSSKKRRSEWEKKAHYYAPNDARDMLPEGDDVAPVCFLTQSVLLCPCACTYFV
jgi:hypothetical protein